MRFNISLLLFCLIFGSVLTKDSLKRRLAQVAKAIKNVADSKERMRKLDQDETNKPIEPESTEPLTTIYTPPAEEYQPPAESDKGESGNATAKDAPVDSSVPVSTKGHTSGMKEAAIQVIKFHSFKLPSRQGPKEEKKISFGVFFYFFGRTIPRTVIFRLRISYGSRLRNLQEEGNADSVRSDCNIKDQSLLDMNLGEEEGKNVDYNCEANATRDEPIANVSLNTDFDMAVVSANGSTEYLDFQEVNFNGNASEESNNLQENVEVVKGSSMLTSSEATTEKYTLNFTGKFEGTPIPKGEIIQMNLVTKKGGENITEKYNCSFINSNSELVCDTSNNPIYTTVKDLHLSSGTTIDYGSGTSLLTIDMKNGTTDETRISTRSGNRLNLAKSSSGLSGGTIAAIVIVCVVAILAASVAAIMLRKPAPPMDNTTVIDIKPSEETNNI